VAMILLLSGTSEGRMLSARLRAEGVSFVASVTTPEARQLFAEVDPPPEVLVTRFSGDALAVFLRERRVSAILDATHPFGRCTGAYPLCALRTPAHVPDVDSSGLAGWRGRHGP
jgi:precorrin-6A/cobalt-precorrin-6A reductase